MYHFYFDKGTVFLPSKKHENLPIIASTYAHEAPHWPKRVEEDLRDAAVKNNMGLVVFHTFDAAAIHAWVAAKKFANPAQIGLFTLDIPERKVQGAEDVPFAFNITTLPNTQTVTFDAARPSLFLQGSGAKVSLDAFTPTEADIIRQSCSAAVTKSSAIRYEGSDDYLYAVSRHVAGEVVRWVVEVVVKAAEKRKR
ncbi:MAG: hypothetical protein FWC71_10760 [Defluviitaleaceae bacterium]|nr:hypothetical protein [Defluviitaleaceae bacterium]